MLQNLPRSEENYFCRHSYYKYKQKEHLSKFCNSYEFCLQTNLNIIVISSRTFIKIL